MRNRVLGICLILAFIGAGILAIAEPNRWLFLFDRRGLTLLLLALVILGIYLLREGGK